MARWEPDSRRRLEQAAVALYEERGFDDTTVAEIAERAGLTERTFFRHYADKREVLFAGSSELQALMVDAVAAAPEGAEPIEAVAGALDAVCAVFAGHQERSRRRQAIIAASAELRERELIKLATLAGAVGEALRRRGVAATAADLAAEAGVAVFRVSFERWTAAPDGTELAPVIRETLAELRAVTAPG